ncbi:MAG: NAD(+)/NADH kinase [Chloroflexi bacterium]|nr:NAD(+)/NADH kinase [Chloroflexota bacterium]
MVPAACRRDSRPHPAGRRRGLKIALARIGVIYHGLIPEAGELARTLIERFGLDGEWWAMDAEAAEVDGSRFDGANLMITIGGDGTILRAMHIAAPRKIPVLGVNMGRVGFMSEVDADHALDQLGWYLEGNARVEERAMLQVDSVVFRGASQHALNDVTIGRGNTPRIVNIRTHINGVHLVSYRADAVVMSTATGSTGYSLALGGPVIDPEIDCILLKPVAAHMSLQGGLLLPHETAIDIRFDGPETGVLSVDGFIDRPIRPGQTVTVRISPHRARFLRRNPTTEFYASLTRRLGMRQESLPRRRRRRQPTRPGP